MRDTVATEKMRKPAVLAITQEFVELGKNVARMEGHADLRQLVFPYPFEGLPADQVRALAEDAYPRFLAALGALK